MANIRCPTCRATPCTAYYEHAHMMPPSPKTWQKTPATGPNQDGLPFPDPCPTDGTLVPAKKLTCPNNHATNY
jgi:hypothetical protein